MRVTVSLYGSLRQQVPPGIGGDPVVLELAEGSSVADVGVRLGIPPNMVFLALVDDAKASSGDEVHEGAEIALMPAFSGGSSITAAVLTISDAAAEGTREDLSGPAIIAMLSDAGFEVVPGVVVPDEAPLIRAALGRWVEEEVSFVVTTGGTGFSPRDITPEVTREVIEREAPGLPEMMRTANAARSPQAALSRAVAGIAGRTLIVNLPGSPGGATESLQVILPLIPHALDLIRGHPSHGHRTRPSS